MQCVFGPALRFFRVSGSARFTHLALITMSKSLPELLKELNTNLNTVDTTTEALCRVMVRRAVITNEVPVPLSELMRLCGLLQMVRECVSEMEARCE